MTLPKFLLLPKKSKLPKFWGKLQPPPCTPLPYTDSIMYEKQKCIIYLCCCSLWIVFLSRREGVWLLITVANCFKDCFSPIACSSSVGGFSASPLVTWGQLSSDSLSSKMGCSCTQRSSALGYKTTNSQSIKSNVDSLLLQRCEMCKVYFNIESQSFATMDPLWKKKLFPSSSVTKQSYPKAQTFPLKFYWFMRHFKSVVIALCIFCRVVLVSGTCNWALWPTMP